MKNNTKNNERIVFIGLLMVAFVLFHFTGANENKMSYFQDRDQDGLSDEEEKSLGTDWQKADTDGDGYTDGVEIKGGFNPLIPAPGDRFDEKTEKEIDKKINNKKTLQKNLTQEFIQKLKNKKSVALETFKKASGETGIVTNLAEIQKLKSASLTEEDIKELTQEVLGNTEIEKEIKTIKEAEIKVLPKIISKNNRKKKALIKKEIEGYLAESGFIMINSLPFNINEGSEFNDKLNAFMLGISDDIVAGNATETKNSKNNLKKAFIELKKIEVPYVLKDIHLKTLSLIQYLLNQDERVVFNKNDPIAMGLMIGRLQAVISEMQDTQNLLDEILLKYNVGTEYNESNVESQKSENVQKK